MKAARISFLIAPLIASSFARSIWIEAESASNKSIQHNGWYSDVKEEVLSGGDFLAHWGDRDGTAQYVFEIPEPGTYTLWLRANPVGSKLEIRTSGKEWQNVNFKDNRHENINIASDDKPDLRFLSWICVGKHPLAAGDSKIEVRFTSENNHHGMLDCLCLTTDQTWKPSGTMKPGEAAPHWTAPEITDANLDQWITFIRPSAEELGWRTVRWHRSLSDAAEEAEKLNRPILLWAMNGHPCGET